MIKVQFKKFENLMRQYETSDDRLIHPKSNVVLRLDGNAFRTLTKEMGLEKPFDRKFNNYMVYTVERIMRGQQLNLTYAYTQSDEISLLLSEKDTTFKHKTRKLLSVITGYVSSYFTIYSGEPCSFDNRISILPTLEQVIDYFRWRQADAERNALNSWCFWTIVRGGKNESQASKILKNKGKEFKHDLLLENGINYEFLPKWQKRGVGYYWELYEKEGFNPITEERVTVQRKRLRTDYKLPKGDEYSDYLINIIKGKH